MTSLGRRGTELAQLKRTEQNREEELGYSSLAVLDDRPHNVAWTRRDLHQNNQLSKANDRQMHDMNANRPKLVRNTPEEEAEIARQIAENPDEAEWTDEDWANAVTTEQLSPEFAAWARERQTALDAGLIEHVTLTLDRDTIDWFKAQTGEDGESGGTRWMDLAAKDSPGPRPAE